MLNSSLDTLHNQYDEYESQESPQPSSRAEPSPSPWFSIADANELWQSTYDDLSELFGLKAFNDNIEIGMSTTKHGNRENDSDSEPSDWFYNFEDDALSPAPMESLSAQGDVSLYASHPSQESPVGSAPYQQATERITRPFEESGAKFAPGSPTDLAKLTNHLGFPPPQVTVPHTTIGNVDDGKQSSVPELYATTSSTPTPFEAKKKFGQNLHKLVTSTESSSPSPDVNWYCPSNYEIVMHDRQSPCKATGGIEPQFQMLTAGSVNAFCDDADSIIANVTNVAIVSNTNTSGKFGFKRRRLSRDLSTLQIPTKLPPGSQHLQSSSDNTLPHAKFQDSIKIPIYPTPPSSFIGKAEHHQVNDAWDRNDPPFIPTTPSCVSPNGLQPPILPSLSSVPDAVNGNTCCSHCPDKIFTGKERKSNLRRHMRDNHKGLSQLECFVPRCTATFKPGRKDNLLKHVKKKHPDIPLPATSTKKKRKADSDLD